MNTVRIITDGSALSTGSVGGWAAILQFDVNGETVEKEISGRIEWATNQRAELQAVIEGMVALNQACAVEIVSDSEYVVKGINYWLARWYYQDWRTSAHKLVANQDQWKRIHALKQIHHVKATWVKGHNSDKFNNRADELANQARLSAV